MKRTIASRASEEKVEEPGKLRSTGVLVLLLVILFILSAYFLQTTVNYPALLTANAPLALSVYKGIVTLLAQGGLLGCGVLLVIGSLRLARHCLGGWRISILVAGSGAGIAWIVGSLTWLVLLPLWGGAHTNTTQVLAMLVFVSTEIAAPLLLAFWTTSLAYRFRMYRVLGSVGVVGLLLIFLRSLVWALNALSPIESGHYGTAGLLAVLAVIGESLWLVWLFLFGIKLLSTFENATPAA